MKENRIVLIITGMLVSLGAFLRLYRLGSNSLWGDEIQQAWISDTAHSISFIVKKASGQCQPPLDYIMLHFSRYLGSSEFFVRLPAAIYGILAIAAIYAFSKSLFGQKEGLMGGFLLCISLFHIRFSQEARPYSLITLLGLMSVYFFYQAITKDKTKYWCYFFISTLLAIYTHSFTQLIMFTEFLFVVFALLVKRITSNEEVKLITTKKFWKTILCLAIVWMLFIPELLLLLKKISYWTSAQNLSLIEQLKMGTEKYISLRYCKTILHAFGSPLPLVYLGFCILGIVASCKSYPLQTSLIIFFLLILPLLELFMFGFEGAVRFHPRYIMFILPVYLISVGRGIVFFLNLITHGFKSILNFRTEPVSVTLVLPIVLIGYFHIKPLHSYYTTPQKQDWRGAAQYIDQEIPDEDRLIFVPAWTKKKYTYYSKKNDTRKFDQSFAGTTWWVTAHRGIPNQTELYGEPILVKTFSDKPVGNAIKIWRNHLYSKDEVLRSLKDIPVLVKEKLVHIPPSSIIFIKLPEMYPRIIPDYIVRLEEYIRDTLGNSTMKVRIVQDFFKMNTSEKSFVLEYDEKQIIDHTDTVLPRLYEMKKTLGNRDPENVNYFWIFKGLKIDPNNLIRNFSFEKRLSQDDWVSLGNQPGFTTSIDDKVSFHGERSLKVDFSGGIDSQYYHTFQEVEVRPDTDYSFSYYIKTQALTSKSGAKVEIVDTKRGHQHLVIASRPLLGTNDWTLIRLDFRTPSDTNLIKVRMRRTGSSYPDKISARGTISGTVWYDCFELVEAHNKK